MSKRHQSSRRRSYGRRQHELQEREARRHVPEASGLDGDDLGLAVGTDPFAFLDPRAPRLRFAGGD